MTYPLYLKEPNSTVATAIRMRVYLNGKPHHYSTGETIYPDAWDFERQRCRTGKRFTMAHNVNLRLDRVIHQAGMVMSRFKTDGINPTWQQFKQALDSALGRGTVTGTAFWDYVDRHIETAAKGREKHNRNSIVTSYRQTVKVLREYERRTRPIDWTIFDKTFGDNFTRWMQTKKGYSVNNTGKHIKTLKTWLNAATLDGINTNLQYKRYRVLTERTEEVYLTTPEIQSLIDIELSGIDTVIRDIFVFACFTGLRYVDYAAVKRSAVRGNRLFLYQSKTGHPVVIPLRPECMAILSRYDGELPKAPENQTMNRAIKSICQRADISKFEQVKTHTARRSFATNLYLEGFPANDIMKITGHKTERSFLLYIRIAPTDTAKRLAEFWGL